MPSPRRFNPEIVLGFLIATLFWVGVLGWQAAYAPTDQEKHKCQEVAAKEGHRSDECKNLWERTTSDPVAFFTFWLVISTVGLGISTLLLWRDTKKIGDRQARDTEILQRAYLNVLPRGIETTRAGAIIGQVAIRNVGHLPARNVSASVRIGWFDSRSETEFDVRRIPVQSIVLPAGAEMSRGTGALESVRGVLSAKRGYVYVWGRVTYHDGFGTDRWLTFCHRYPCETVEGVAGSTQGIDPKHARHHHEHNDGN